MRKINREIETNIHTRRGKYRYAHTDIQRHTPIQTDSETDNDRQTIDRQTIRQKHKDIQTETDRHTGRHPDNDMDGQHIHTGKERDRDIHTYRERHIDIQTETYRQRQSNICTESDTYKQKQQTYRDIQTSKERHSTGDIQGPTL